MKFYLAILLLSLFIACSAQSEGDSKNANAGKDSLMTEAGELTGKSETDSSYEKSITGERIDGPANIRDGVNGQLLFTLNDNVLISCAAEKKDWYRIGLLMDIEPGGLELRVVKNGSAINVDGKPVGEILSDMQIFPNPDNPAKGELTGYTHKGNIQPHTIIEKALEDYLTDAVADRSLEGMQALIKSFSLEETDGFEGYTVYYNYESWLDDPSPMWRIGLFFRKGKLQAILHSRPLALTGTSAHALARGYGCMVYDDVEGEHAIVEMIGGFVGSVD